MLQLEACEDQSLLSMFQSSQHEAECASIRLQTTGPKKVSRMLHPQTAQLTQTVHEAIIPSLLSCLIESYFLRTQDSF